MERRDNKELSKTVSMLKEKARSTFNSNIVTNPDFKFGALYNLDFKDYKEPLLIQSTDNIGSKMKFAISSNTNETIGIDLAAMSINNIISTGAKPLFFSNYVGMKNIDYETIEKITVGMVETCKKSDCVMIGGETTFIPDMYLPGDYDLVGFTLGVVDKEKLLGGNKIQKGDLILGLPSSGLHFSGFRELQEIMSKKEFKLEDRFPHTTRSFKEILLTPTRVYYQQIRKVLSNNCKVHAMKQVAHGLYDDIYEILPEKFGIDFQEFQMHEIFKTIMEMGEIEEKDMFKYFNCGVGMVIFVPQDEFENVERSIGEKLRIIGTIS